MHPTPRAWRPLIMGRNGAVASNHPLATQAGLDALRAGGNAVDAAVAIALTLGVVEPHMSGLGGDGFYHVHLGRSSAAHVYNGTGGAPQAASAERFARGIPVDGPESASVPGALAGIGAMHDAHGRLPWKALFRAAIEHAREGFAATHTFRHFLGEARTRLLKNPRAREIFLQDGELPALGALIRQPDLARTLEEIAAEGADTFYRGRLAARLAAAMKESGVLVDAADLDSCQAERQAPIGIAYRGYEVRQTPPNSTGFTLLQMLKIVERFDLAGADPALRVHLMVEAKKRAFQDRERYGTDPRFEAVPLDRLLSEEHAAKLAERINPGRAADISVAAEKADGDTTYFCTVDAEGNAVSGIQSLNAFFGGGAVAGDTGVLLNSRMAYWHLGQDHANRLVPGKRVRHTMNAPMVFRDGKLWAVFGTPGADNQVQVNLQILVAMADLGLDPQQAVEAPRWTSSQAGQGANWPHEGDGALTVEPMDADILRGLEARGHRLAQVGALEGACSVEVIRVLENGVRMAGSDPRRDGWAGAY